MKNLSLLATLLLSAAIPPSEAHASEAQAYCNLVQAQAHVRTALLGSSEAFASMAPSLGSGQTMLAGVRKSLAGVRRADLVERIATEDCAAYAATLDVSAALTGAEMLIERQAQLVRKFALEKALAAAEASLGQEQMGLKAQTATWLDVRTALDLRDRIVQDRAQAEMALARLAASPTPPAGNLRENIERSLRAQAKTTSLHSQLEAASSWDLKLEVGMRRETSTGAQTPYAGVAYSYSFGSSRAAAAAQSSDALAYAYRQSQEDGPAQLLVRKRVQMQAVHSSQIQELAGLEQRAGLLRSARDQVSTARTTTALRMTRNLTTEMLLLDADLQTLRVRQTLLGAWLVEQAEVVP